MVNNKTQQPFQQPISGSGSQGAFTPVGQPVHPQGKQPNNAPVRGQGRPSVGAGQPGQPGKPSPNKPGTPNTPGKPGAVTKRTVLVVIGAVIAVVAIWLLVWLFACGGSGMFDPSAQTGQAPYKSEEEMQAELDRVVEEGMFNISIASVIQFENGQSEGTAYIENVPGNHYNMQVTITEDDTGEVLYESGVLQPNQYIESIALTRQLDVGTYPATATFTALDPTTYDEIGTAAAKVTLNVLS